MKVKLFNIVKEYSCILDHRRLTQIHNMLLFSLYTLYKEYRPINVYSEFVSGACDQTKQDFVLFQLVLEKHRIAPCVI